MQNPRSQKRDLGHPIYFPPMTIKLSRMGHAIWWRLEDAGGFGIGFVVFGDDDFACEAELG